VQNREIEYSIIVPLYNEELVINEVYHRLKTTMGSTGRPYELIFVNDGSRDRTMELARNICNLDSSVKLLSFSRNFGHQAAITAGMEHAGGRAIVVIDADLQDPPEVIPLLIEKWQAGYDVVYGQRIKRNGESFFKTMSAAIFYRILRSLTDLAMPVDAGDFRLIDRKVRNALIAIPERNRYVRGLVSWVGFKQAGVEYVREERFAGETKYPLRKMIRLAGDAITSFSYKPLKIATYVGATVSLLSFLCLIGIMSEKLFTRFVIPGWTAIAMIGLFCNGMILLVLGIIGEYIGRIYDEVKGRPLYVIDEKMGF
jgi:dolichol-phosphate mannosyltransferase